MYITLRRNYSYFTIPPSIAAQIRPTWPSNFGQDYVILAGAGVNWRELGYLITSPCGVSLSVHVLAGIVRFRSVKKRVENADTPHVARHVADMLPDMLPTGPKKVLVRAPINAAPTWRCRHVDNMSACRYAVIGLFFCFVAIFYTTTTEKMMGTLIL